MLVILFVCLLLMSHTESCPGCKENEETSTNMTNSWRHKIQHFYDLFDDNHDGLVTEYEYIDLTRQRAREYLGEDAADKVDIVMKWAWNTVWSVKENNYSTALTKEEVVRAHAQVTLAPGPTRQITFIDGILFDAADSDDKGGELSLDEFKKMHAVFNVGENDSILSFQSADDDGNEVLDKDEYQSAWLGYFRETVWSKNSNFFGEYFRK